MEADPARVPFVHTRTTAGLQERFEKVLSANAAALNRLAWSYTNSPADREDLLQDIAMAIWQALPAFRGECSEKTFIYRVAHNRALTFIASRHPQDAALNESSDPADPSPAADQSLAREQQNNRLMDAVRRLPLPYRQVVVLMLEGLEYSEIAEVLGISESNVGVRLTRARPLLRQIMEGQK